MLDFIQDLSDSLPTNASNAGPRSKITGGQLIDCLIGQAVDDLVRNNGDKEGAKAVSLNAKALISQASDEVGSMKQLSDFVESKARDYIEKLKATNQLAGDAKEQALVNSQARFAGLCLFLNKIMSRVSNSCYYRKLECDRHELEGHDYNIATEYDGFSQVKLNSVQVEKAVRSVFAEISASLLQIVSAGLVDDWNAKTFCTPAYATVWTGIEYMSFNDFGEYVKHRTIQSQQVRVEAVATA